ncbi:hypothetical protein CY0110_18212 [Crocosphaera chwakensis CCY0110]|uniref:Uncharacterized protein n=1 Tax=Crocosphaera chwakensis CCY0110 TaxID=391612 RepID=A3IIX4_9CHRO|nr:hypothetical protein CY0110_18212 [Crocosphaera chwakensis CCY0110]
MHLVLVYLDFLVFFLFLGVNPFFLFLYQAFLSLFSLFLYLFYSPNLHQSFS